jgi:hypothetical protein
MSLLGLGLGLGQRDLYEVVIKTPRRFNLCIDFVACGASFRMASRLMDCTRAESGLGIYGGCSAVVASNYTWLVCAYCLQTLSDVLRQVWAFSIALDGSIHQGMSYVDVRVRFHFAGKLLNFHLMAIPLFERHTGENMFNVLFASWMLLFLRGRQNVLLCRRMVRGV